MHKEIIEAPFRTIAFLKMTLRHVKSLGDRLKELEQGVERAIDDAAERAEKQGIELDTNDPELCKAFDELNQFKADKLKQLRTVIAYGESVELPMDSCRKLAQSLESCSSTPSPPSFACDSAVEMRRLTDYLENRSIENETGPTQPITHNRRTFETIEDLMATYRKVGAREGYWSKENRIREIGERVFIHFGIFTSDDDAKTRAKKIAAAMEMVKARARRRRHGREQSPRKIQPKSN